MLAFGAVHEHCDLIKLVHMNQEVEYSRNKQDQFEAAKQLSEQRGGNVIWMPTAVSNSLWIAGSGLIPLLTVFAACLQ